MTWAYAAFALMAAERHRRSTGEGQEVRIPLGDVAIAALGNLGQIAEVSVGGVDRPRMGNDLYGAFGSDFQAADGVVIMIAAITRRQWTGLISALEIGPTVAALEGELGVSFETDEVVLFHHRDRLFPIVEQAVGRLPVAEIAGRFDGEGVCWDRYQGAKQAVAADPRWTATPILSDVAHPSGHHGDIPYQEWIDAGLIRGAGNCGLDHKVGSLSPGKQADIVLIDTANVLLSPMNNAVCTAVQGANVDHVDTVFVAGRAMKSRGALVGVDVGQVRRAVEQSRNHLLRAVGLPLDEVDFTD